MKESHFFFCQPKKLQTKKEKNYYVSVKHRWIRKRNEQFSFYEAFQFTVAIEDEGNYIEFNQEKEKKKREHHGKLISNVYLTYYAKKIYKHLLDNSDWVSIKNEIVMAHVATNTTDTSVRPLMDRLTHAVIKETSKSL